MACSVYCSCVILRLNYVCAREGEFTRPCALVRTSPPLSLLPGTPSCPYCTCYTLSASSRHPSNVILYANTPTQTHTPLPLSHPKSHTCDSLSPMPRAPSPLTPLTLTLPTRPLFNPPSVVDTDSMNGALSALRAQLSEAEAHTKAAREQQRVVAESKVSAITMCTEDISFTSLLPSLLPFIALWALLEY